MTAAALDAALTGQAAACRALGSPLTGRVLDCLVGAIRPEGGALAARLCGWPGDVSSRGASLPLRLAGGLHALVRSGASAPLARAYADPGAVDDARLHALLMAEMAAHEVFLLAWIDSAPQTNEVRRSAVLIAAAQELAARMPLPFALSELGASVGLNLLWDRYALQIGPQRFGATTPVLTLAPDWTGPLPPEAVPVVAEREGTDLNPLDPVTDRERMLSYIWADQADRLARTVAALDEAARLRPRIARADAADWLERRLAARHPGRLHLVFNTVAWQYFPAEVQARCTALLDAAGARATPEAPLAHLAMEADAQPADAGLTLRLWPGTGRVAAGEAVPLGRADFHGRWIRWQGWPG